MKFVKREMMPHMLKIAGGTYPAIYSYRALIEMEAEAEIMHGYTILKLKESYDDDGKQKAAKSGIPVFGLLAREVVAIAYGMMVAAGVEVDYDELCESVSADEQTDLIRQLRAIVLAQEVEPDEKNK